jgi:hypothetical protein
MKSSDLTALYAEVLSAISMIISLNNYRILKKQDIIPEPVVYSQVIRMPRWHRAVLPVGAVAAAACRASSLSAASAASS